MKTTPSLFTLPTATAPTADGGEMKGQTDPVNLPLAFLDDVEGEEILFMAIQTISFQIE